MSLDFPSSPSIGQQYPAAPVAGIPTYTWDGEKWLITSQTVVAAPPATQLPLMNGAAAIGTSFRYAREDHVHPSNTGMLATTGGQTLTGGFNFTPFALPGGNITVNALLGNYQWRTNNGAFTITAPSSDCAVDILVTNTASAGGISFVGFTIGPNTGDLLSIANGASFVISIRRINAVSTYVIKALQ